MIELRGREVPLSYVVTLLVGMVIGFALARFGGLLARYPVETVLVSVQIVAVLVLVWACREMLRGSVRFGGRPAAAPVEPEPVAEPPFSGPLPRNGVRH